MAAKHWESSPPSLLQLAGLVSPFLGAPRLLLSFTILGSGCPIVAAILGFRCPIAPQCGGHLVFLVTSSSLPGWLRDVTGDYRASFVVAGAFLLAGTLVLTTLPDFFCTAATSSGHSATPRTAPGLHKDPCCAGRSYLPPGEDPE